MHLRHRWLHISRLQFKARSQDFNAELIPVHSPLLRESCLVSYPPLTYMLKFSGFADLTSCQDIGNAKEAQQSKGSGARSDKATDEAPKGVRLVASRNSNVHFMHQGQQRAPWCTETDSRHRRLHKQSLEARRQHETEVDSEAGMLSGISRKRSIRSNPCWFTEFCKSQCLSHFAAPFVVV